jgi:hypothetical protein
MAGPKHDNSFGKTGPGKRGANMPDDPQSSESTSKALATPASTSTTVELAKLAFDKLGESSIGTLTKGLDATTKVAERGVIPFLLGTGVLLAFYGLSLKIEVHGKPLADLSTANLFRYSSWRVSS